MNFPSETILLSFLIIAAVWGYRIHRALRFLGFAPVVAPPERIPDKSMPLVSVIVPARNEETNIHDCISSLLEQDYSPVEIIAANDNSVDHTEDILRSFGDRITCINVPPTPGGWTGKNFAIHSAVQMAAGEWLLFTDADTRHERTCLSAAMAHASSDQLEFLTLLPGCLVDTFAEKLIQPAAMGYLGLWFPLEKVNDPEHPLAFANGQYLLIKRTAYEKMGGHGAVRGEFLEDFALMRNAKARDVPSQCALGFSVYGTRMYGSVAAIWRGWRRIYLHAFEKKRSTLILKALSVFSFSVLPFVLFGLVVLLYGSGRIGGFSFGVATGVMVLIMAVCLVTCGVMKAHKKYAFLHPLAAFILSGIILDAFRIAVTGGKTVWR